MVLLSVWGVREVRRALKRLVHPLSVVKSAHSGVELGHISSIASVLYHHRSATV